MSNYQITYAKLLSMVNHFFMQRGFGDLADNDSVMLYINMSIQDIYNKDNFTFLYSREEATLTNDDGKYAYFQVKYPIRKVWCAQNDTGEMYPTLKFPGDNEYVFEQGTDKILAPTGTTEMEIVYIKSYCWVEYNNVINGTTNTQGTNINNNGSQLIVPLPHSFIPALVKKIYDWAAPINLMAGETSEYDFHGHAETRLRELVADDGLTDNLQISDV